MSTIDRIRPTTAVRIVLRWSIDRRVAAASDAVDLPVSHRGGRAAPVVLRIDLAAGRITAELDDPATSTTLPLALGECRVRLHRTGAALHAQAVRLSDSVRIAEATILDPSADTAAYAATRLLEELGITGGRYGRPEIATEFV
ncbi:MAG: hypothetical protein AAGF47_01835 [Planctomycetota bacterium]